MKSPLRDIKTDPPPEGQPIIVYQKHNRTQKWRFLVGWINDDDGLLFIENSCGQEYPLSLYAYWMPLPDPEQLPIPQNAFVLELRNGITLYVTDEGYRPKSPSFTATDAYTGRSVAIEKDTDEYEEALRMFGYEELY